MNRDGGWVIFGGTQHVASVPKGGYSCDTDSAKDRPHSQPFPAGEEGR